MKSRWGSVTVVALASAAPASAQVFVDDFENGTNAGHWTLIGGPGGSIQPAGGNPGGYFGGTAFNYPVYRASGESPFTGNFRDRFVQDIRVDLITRSHQGALFPLTLAILTDNGTPAEPSDDWGAYYTGTQPVPQTGAGWDRFFFFFVPSWGSPSLPPGWHWLDGTNPAPDWPTLMSNVSRIEFLFAPPGTISNFPVWDSGIDNASITVNPPDCYTNCDVSTTPPLLNVNDFICFQARFAAGDPYCDCDQNSALNVNDFVCFLHYFVQGCP